MSSVLELTGTQRVLLGTLSAHALTMVALNTLKNSVWMYFTGKWFKGKPVRFVGTCASLGVFVVMWKPGRLEAVGEVGHWQRDGDTAAFPEWARCVGEDLACQCLAPLPRTGRNSSFLR